MHFASLTCFKMSETVCLGENSRVSKRRRKTRRGKRWRNKEEKRPFINEFMKQRKHRVAPSNTTQFLMEDREKIEPILNLSPSSSMSSPSTDEREENSFELDQDLDNFNEQFFLKDFETTYRQICRHNLDSLSKNELLQKVTDLQSHRDCLEKEKQFCFKNCSGGVNRMNEFVANHSSHLERELLELKRKNELLCEENKALKQSVETK